MALLAEALGARAASRCTRQRSARPSGDVPVRAGAATTAIVEMAQASGLALVAEHERDAARGLDARHRRAHPRRGRARARARSSSRSAAARRPTAARGAIDAIRARRRPARRAARRPVRRRDALRGRAAHLRPAEGRGRRRRSRWLEERLERLALELPRDPRGVPATRRRGRARRAGCGRRSAPSCAPARAAVLDALGVDERLRAAQLVVAGEGCLDEQSLGGKVVGELVRRARAAGRADPRGRRLEPADARGRRRAPGIERVWIASTLEEIEAAGRSLGAASTPPDRRDVTGGSDPG